MDTISTPPTAMQPSPADAPIISPAHFFDGGGEMSERIRAFDWSRTPLGPLESWAPSLRFAVNLCLNSRFPMLIWWGPQLIKIYNDAYRPILGSKHPSALGQPGQTVWPEIWDSIGPMLESVLAQGDATWSDNQLLLIERNGFREECYFTFSYSPIRLETDISTVAGVFTAVTETTQPVIGERRMRLLRELASCATGAASARSVYEACSATIATAPNDIPFSLLYQLDADVEGATLISANGLPDDHPGAGSHIPFTALATKDQSTAAAPPADHPTHWQLGAAARTRLPQPTDLSACERLIPSPLLPTIPVRSALTIPLILPGSGRLIGFLVLGVSPHLTLDSDYRGFFDLVAGHIVSGVSAALAREDEHRRAEALAAIDRAKTDFFSNVSHEFRTPLTLMLGPLDDILSSSAPTLPPEQRERLQLAQRNGLRLLKLVNTMLDFSRIEAGRTEAIYAPTDLTDLTADLVSFFTSAVERAGLRLIYDGRPLSQPVYVDVEMWEKIVFNLLSNALKFTFQGAITVTLRQVANHVELTVRDTGVGIPPDEQPHIFDRFHRVRDTRARTHEGAGIGLALVSELTHLHGGSVTVESAIGVGSTFTVTLPFGSAHLPAERISAQRALPSTALGASPYVEEALRWLPSVEDGSSATLPEPNHKRPQIAAIEAPVAPIDALFDRAAQLGDHIAVPTQHARILLVDDNSDMRAYLTRLLSARYHVESATNGATALAILRATPHERLYDLLISDVMMPEIDGLALLREIRADASLRSLPVMLLSARAGETAAIEALEGGADEYLVKPFSARELLARVAARLELTRVRSEAITLADELATILGAIADPIYVYDADGFLVMSNNAAQALTTRLTGSPVAQSRAEQRYPFPLLTNEGAPIPPDHAPLIRALRGETITGDGALDVQAVEPNGATLLLSASAAPLRDSLGAIRGGVVILRDVTQRRLLERRTHDALDALLAMAEALVAPPSPTTIHPTLDTPETAGGPGAERILAVGTVARQLCELTRVALDCQRVGIISIDAKTGAQHPIAVAGLSQAQARQWWREQLEQPPIDESPAPELVARLRAGETFELDLTAPPFDQAPNPYNIRRILCAPMRIERQFVGLLSLDHGAQDHHYTPEELNLAGAVAKLLALVIERERLLDEREDARATEISLRQTNKRMDEFLGIASHELRTPLTSVKANIQIAARRLGRLLTNDADAIPASAVASLDELLARADRQTDLLDRIVGDLLDVSRIQADKLELRLIPCDLTTIVRDAITEQRHAAGERAITLTLPDEPLPLNADPDRIGQVITNYLTNALKYSAATEPVAITVTRVGQQARVAVRDHGPGLPKSEHERIWERFHRAPGIEVQSGSGVGLGLGLHISKTIVERHHGAVGVTSAPGKGSTFWFTLPLAEHTPADDHLIMLPR